MLNWLLRSCFLHNSLCSCLKHPAPALVEVGHQTWSERAVGFRSLSAPGCGPSESLPRAGSQLAAWGCVLPQSAASSQASFYHSPSRPVPVARSSFLAPLRVLLMFCKYSKSECWERLYCDRDGRELKNINKSLRFPFEWKLNWEKCFTTC